MGSPVLVENNRGCRTLELEHHSPSIACCHTHKVHHILRVLPLDDFKRFLYCKRFVIIALVNMRLLRCQLCLVCGVMPESSLVREDVAPPMAIDDSVCHWTAL